MKSILEGIVFLTHCDATIQSYVRKLLCWNQLFETVFVLDGRDYLNRRDTLNVKWNRLLITFIAFTKRFEALCSEPSSILLTMIKIFKWILPWCFGVLSIKQTKKQTNNAGSNVRVENINISKSCNKHVYSYKTERI